MTESKPTLTLIDELRSDFARVAFVQIYFDVEPAQRRVGEYSGNAIERRDDRAAADEE